MIRFYCPGCGLDVSAPDDCAGRTTKCRRCHGHIVVPTAAAPVVLKPQLQARHLRQGKLLSVVAIVAVTAMLSATVLLRGPADADQNQEPDARKSIDPPSRIGNPATPTAALLPTAAELESQLHGMTPNEVRDKLGDPALVDSVHETWTYYSKTRNPLTGKADSEVDICFHDGRVFSVYAQREGAAVQRNSAVAMARASPPKEERLDAGAERKETPACDNEELLSAWEKAYREWRAPTFNDLKREKALEKLTALLKSYRGHHVRLRFSVRWVGKYGVEVNDLQAQQSNLGENGLRVMTVVLGKHFGERTITEAHYDGSYSVAENDLPLELFPSKDKLLRVEKGDHLVVAARIIRLDILKSDPKRRDLSLCLDVEKIEH